VDLGGWATTGDERVYATGGVGVSVAVTDELQLGAEVYAEASLATSGEDERWVAAGPNVAYTHGRFWITASLPIGLHRAAPDLLPRVIWAVAF
jgi:hypothetical protein